MKVRSAIVIVAFAVVLALPGAAYAAFSSAAAPSGVASSTTYKQPQYSKPTTPTYDLDWTLPTAGKSGCMVCHGDKNLVRIIGGQTVSLYVDTVVLQNSVHANVPCTQCHLDFAYKTPHNNMVANGDEWKNVAKLSCQNCHRFEFGEYSNGVHSPALTPGETSTVGAPGSTAPGKPRPLCGDCHGGHAIPSKTDTAGVAAVRATALQMCGTCHTNAANDYNDYYHGAAYRRGAPDAPACWQCHNTHLILPSSDRQSWTNADNLPTTCGQCHKAANDQYTQYAQLVHKRYATLAQNPIMEIANSARQAIDSVMYRVTHMFGQGSS